MSKYSIVIDFGEYGYEWARVDTLAEAKKLALEIVRIGCLGLENTKLSEDQIKNIRVNIYKDDKEYYSRKLRGSYQKYLMWLNNKESNKQ